MQLGKQMDRQIDRQIKRQINRQIDGGTMQKSKYDLENKT